MENRAKTTTPQEAPSRFLFDQSFDIAPRSAKKRKPEEEKPPEPTFSREELEAARQDGYEKGRIAGSEEVSAGIESEIGRLVAVIGEQLPVLAAAQAAANERLLHDGARLATTIARKILPAYTARHGMEEVGALITQCLQTLIDQSKITVRVGAPYVDAVREHLDSAASASAFDGRFLVEADETMGASDCRVLWQGGGLERREADIWRQVDAITENFLPGLAEEAPGGMTDTDDREPDISAAAPDDMEADQSPAAEDDQTNATEAPAGAPDPLEDR